MASSTATTYGILIGRFQPFHKGHAQLVQHILAEVDALLFVVGSSAAPRNLRNPWSLSEREAMIRASLPAEEGQRLHFRGIPDVFYDDRLWVHSVKAVVADACPSGAKIRLYGHTKDNSSYYLALFPDWDYRELPNYDGLSATPFREALLEAGPERVHRLLHGPLTEVLPEGVLNWLDAFVTQPEYAELCAEAEAVRSYQQLWEGSPWPPVFVTVDALVTWRDQVLLIRRGRRPGLGLLALPGGFLDPGERIFAACRRELAEETGLQLGADVPVLNSFVADHPDRSDRGRFISHVYHFALDPEDECPAVQGGDDAAEADWHPLSTLDSSRVFEDHYALIQHLLSSK